MTFLDLMGITYFLFGFHFVLYKKLPKLLLIMVADLAMDATRDNTQG